jgi:hypothetical protein
LDKAAAANSAHLSKRAKKAHETKNADGQSVHAVKLGTKLNEKKDAAGKSLHAAKMLAKRNYSAVADESKANFECPNCHQQYFYATPHEKNGNKHGHQRCGGKKQVLVQSHAMH